MVSAVTRAFDEKFRAAHPEVADIVHDARGQVADGLARLRNAQLAGEPVDVIVCAANPVNTSYARLGLIRPLDGLADRTKDRYAAGALENFTLDGHVWGIPLSAVNLTTFFYNRSLFAKAGVGPPATYEQLRDAARALRSIGVIPVVHQGKNAWMWPLYFMSGLAQTTGNRQVAFVEDILAGRRAFTDAPGTRALELTRRWIDDGVLDAQTNELDLDAVRSVFYSQRAAAYFGGSWDVPDVAANATFEWGVFRFPKYSSEPGDPVAFGGAESGLCVSATSRHPELAEAYVALAADDDNARELLRPLAPLATSHRNVAGSDDPVARELRTYQPAAKFLDWIWPRELTDSIQRTVQDMMGGGLTPAAAARRMQAKYDSMVRGGYRYGPPATPDSGPGPRTTP